MNKMFYGLIACVGLSFVDCSIWAQSVKSINYCYSPCKSTLSGRVHIKHVVLDDPKLRFTVYTLKTHQPISVPESGTYESASGVDRIQLQFDHGVKPAPIGVCINAVGELVGAETATDIYPLVMRIDSYSECEIKK